MVAGKASRQRGAPLRGRSAGETSHFAGVRREEPRTGKRRDPSRSPREGVQGVRVDHEGAGFLDQELLDPRQERGAKTGPDRKDIGGEPADFGSVEVRSHHHLRRSLGRDDGINLPGNTDRDKPCSAVRSAQGREDGGTRESFRAGHDHDPACGALVRVEGTPREAGTQIRGEEKPPRRVARIKGNLEWDFDDPSDRVFGAVGHESRFRRRDREGHVRDDGVGPGHSEVGVEAGRQVDREGRAGFLPAHRIHRRSEIPQRAAQFALRTDPDETVDDHQGQSLDTLAGAASGRESLLFPFGELFPGQRSEPLDTIGKNHLDLPSPSLEPASYDKGVAPVVAASAEDLGPRLSRKEIEDRGGAKPSRFIHPGFRRAVSGEKDPLRFGHL